MTKANIKEIMDEVIVYGNLRELKLSREANCQRDRIKATFLEAFILRKLDSTKKPSKKLTEQKPKI